MVLHWNRRCCIANNSMGNSKVTNITSGTGFPLNWEDVSIVFLEIIYTGITVLIIAKERIALADSREK